MENVKQLIFLDKFIIDKIKTLGKSY